MEILSLKAHYCRKFRIIGQDITDNRFLTWPVLCKAKSQSVSVFGLAVNTVNANRKAAEITRKTALQVSFCFISGEK